jgi:hypothetical protein
MLQRPGTTVRIGRTLGGKILREMLQIYHQLPSPPLPTQITKI